MKESSIISLPTPITVNRVFRFYVYPKTGLPTYGIGKIFDLHQYYWSNQTKQKLTAGDNAYYIILSNFYDENSLELIKSQF